MKFTEATNKNGLLQDVDFFCGSTSATYPTLDKTRNINQAYHNVALLIWQSDHTWNWDDVNQADEAKASRTMANASATYVIPTTAFEIKGVEIKDANGDYHKLKPIKYEDITMSIEEYMATPNMPREYLLDGNIIRLFPPPATSNVTLSSGMVLRISRVATEFTSGSSTEPGFPQPFHRILSISAALDFMEGDNPKRNMLIMMRDRIEKGLVRFYSKRAYEVRTIIKPRGKKRARQYR